jgi:hypothetical protein
MSTLQSILKPDNVTQGLNVAYTVPAGKVARVKAVLNASSGAQSTQPAGSSSTVAAGTGGANSANVDMVLRAGDVLSSSRTAASASGTTAAIASTSTTTMTVNGNNSCQVTSTSQMGGHPNSTQSITGTASFGWIAEEYPE